jgi:hypothetical protein
MGTRQQVVGNEACANWTIPGTLVPMMMVTVPFLIDVKKREFAGLQAVGRRGHVSLSRYWPVALVGSPRFHAGTNPLGGIIPGNRRSGI